MTGHDSPESAVTMGRNTQATVDPVIAHFGQISAEQKQALRVAISAFEPVEAELETIQPEKASFEVTNNIAISLKLVGDIDRSCRITQRGLQRFPLAEGLLRIRINELVDKDDIAAIRILTDSRANELPTGILVILAEAYANSGVLACFDNIKTVLDTRNVDEQIAEDLLALSIHALWVAGKHTAAIDSARAQLTTAPANVPLATLFARMLRKQRNILESENQARQCLAAVIEATLPPAILQVADLLYDFRLYLEASDLYGRLADTHVWGPLTQRYLICLVESDQRERARLLLSKNMDMFQIGDAVTSGVAVQLRHQNDMRWIAVEYPGLSQLGTWPEVVPPDSPQAGYVVGKKLGEKAEVDSGFGKVVAEIVQIESILSFAARKAHEVIAASAGPSGPLWSVNLGKPDGGLDVEPILESLRRRSKYVESLFAQYSKQPFPISALADALGSDPVTLLLEWPFKYARFYVCSGTRIEREQSRELVRKESVRYVLDLVTLAELARYNVFEKSIKLIGKPLIPQTLREQLLGLIQFVDAPQATSNMREENGQFYMTDIPARYYEQRKQFLHKLLDYVNKYCEVVPTFGPATVTNNQRLLAQLLDNASIDAIYLALERKAIFLSEDGALRFLATQVGVTDTLWLQPLLMHLRDTDLLKQPEYSRIVIEKLSFGHDFISVGSDDLIWAAKKNTSALSPQVKSVLETFKRPTLELRSGIHVCAGFLRVVAEELQIQLVKAYYKECCDVLCYGREDIADGITKVMRTVMLRVLALLEQKASSKSRQEFMYALAEEEADILFRPKKIVLAIQSIFR